MIRTAGGIFRWAISLPAAVALVSLGGLLSQAAHAAAITSTWNFGSGGGDGTIWTQAGNWTNSDSSSRFPNNGADTFSVSIPSPGDIVVIGSGLSGSTIGINDLLLVGTLNIQESRLTVLNPLTNDATIQLGYLQGRAEARLTVLNGSLTNNGDLNFLFGGATGGHVRTLDANLVNAGDVTIEAGTSVTFSKAGGQHSNTGTFSIGTGVQLSFAINNTWDISAGTLSNQGAISLVQDTLNVSGGSIENQGSFTLSNSTFNFTGSSIDNQGSFMLSGSTFNFTGGTLTGNPILLGPNSRLNVGGSASVGTVIAEDALTYGGDLAAGQNVTLRTAKSGPAVLTMTGGFTNRGTMRIESSGTGVYEVRTTPLSTIVNEGTLSLAGKGNPFLTHAINAHLDNKGTFTVIAGVLARFNATSPQITNSGLFTVEAGAGVQVDGGSTFTMNGGTLNNLGSVTLFAGTLNFNQGSFTGNPLILQSSNLNNGSGSRSGTVVFQGTGNYSGDIAAAQTVVLRASGPSFARAISNGAFANYGLLKWEGSTVAGAQLILNLSQTLTNLGTLDFQGQTTDPENSLTGNLVNQGLIEIHSNSTANFQLAGPSQNDGTLRVGAGGQLTIGGGTLTNGPGAHIEGQGKIVTTTLVNDGTVAPGTSPGIFTFVGAYNQGDGGLLSIELVGPTVGTQYDRLAITGSANLDGDLLVDLLGTYLPLPTDTFTILTATSIAGGFDNTPGGLLTFPEGTFNVTYTTNSVMLSNFHSVPEPGSMGLLLCGAVMVCFCLRRRGWAA